MSEIDKVLVSKEEIDKLLKAHDGDVALLFLYSKLHEFDEDKAADILCRTGKEISSAEEKLRRMGLIGESTAKALKKDTVAEEKPVSRQVVEPSDEVPEYTTEDVLQRAKEESCFDDLLTETRRALGRALSTADMKILLGIYDYLGMPADVIMILVNYCVETTALKGDGRRPNMRYIEKVAFEWTRREINTFDKAEEYIKNEQEYHSIEKQVLRAIGITDREATPSERKDIRDWIQKGFEVDALAVAYDRTVMATGNRTWKYMSTIIGNWHKNGIHTVKEIEEKDSSSNRLSTRTNARQTAKPSTKQVGREGLDALQKKMNNK